MTRPRTRLQFEELESRTLLSAAALAAPVKVAAAVVRTTPPPAVLSGTITGTYVLGPSLSTTGATYRLNGSGNVSFKLLENIQEEKVKHASAAAASPRSRVHRGEIAFVPGNA